MNDFLILEAMSDIDIITLESEFDAKYSLINEFSLSDLVNGIKDFIDNLIEELLKFFSDLMMDVEARMEANNLNKRLDALKTNMAHNRVKYAGTKLSVFSVGNYKKYYTDYITKYTLELKRGLNKEFKTVAEYEAWEEDMIAKLSDFDYKISNEERWKLTTAVNKGVTLTLSEAQHRRQNLEMVRNNGTKTLKELQEYLTGSSKRSSLIETTRDEFMWFKRKDMTIKKISRKIAMVTEKVGRFISKHTLLSILIILAIIKILK